MAIMSAHMAVSLSTLFWAVASVSASELDCASEDACGANSMLQRGVKRMDRDSLDEDVVIESASETAGHATDRFHSNRDVASLFSPTGVEIRMPQENSTSFPTEVVYSFDVEANGFEVNDTHVIIPQRTKLQANYIKRLHALEDEEVGVAVQSWAKQRSVFGADIVAGVAEKMHAFYRKKPLDEDAYARAQNYTAPPGVTHNTSARHGLDISALYASKYTTQLFRTAGMPNEEVSKSASDGSPVPAGLKRRSLAAADAMRERIGALPDSALEDPFASFDNCLHFAGVSFNEESFFVPLGAKLSAFRGQTAAAPFLAVDLMQGVGFWTYRPTSNKVELFLGVSIDSRAPYPLDDEPVEGEIFVGPASGIGAPVTIESRNPIGRSSLAFGLSRAADAYAKDFEFLFQDPEELCTPSVREQIERSQPVWSSLQTKTFSNQPFTHADFQMLVGITALTLNCATDYLRPDHLNGADVNVPVLAALAHFMMEIDADMHLTLLDLGWNSFNTSLIRESSGELSICDSGFSLEVHSCEQNHGDVCRKDDGSGNWMPPGGCKRFGGKAPFSVKDDGSDAPCRVDVPASGCMRGFTFECGTLPHGDVCRRNDDSGNWQPPVGCERFGGKPPWSVITGSSDICIASDKTCNEGFHFEGGRLPHGDVCRKDDDSGNWHPPRGCERASPRGQAPFSVQLSTQKPCRVAAARRE